MQRRTLLWQAAAAAALGVAGVARANLSPGASEIVLGHTGILRGPLGAPVQAMLAGATLAFDDFNARGGHFGRPLRVVSLDDELKPDKAVANYEALLRDHQAFAFFGCVGSGTTAAAAPLLKRSGAPLIGAYAVADSARDKVGGAAYFVRAGTGREAQALVQHLATIGLQRIAVAHLDNPGGAEALQQVRQAVTERGLTLAAAAALRGDLGNVTEVGAQFAGVSPQAVVMYLGGALAGELMKAMWQAGGTAAFYGMSIVPGDLTAKVVGERARGLAISQVIPHPWGEAEPATREYRRLAESRGVPVGYYSFEGYLNAQVLLEALRRTGRDLTRQRLHASLRALKTRVSGMDVDFTGGGHTGSRFIELVQVTREGRFLR